MQPAYDPTAPKKPTNLSLNSDLLIKARALNINLSATLEQALADTLRQRQQEQWRRENRQAMEAYNQQIETQGVFSDGLRTF